MSEAQFKIGDRRMDAQSAPYVIAEVGVNHGGSLERAKRLIESAARGGAQAVKFQTYKAEKLASRHSPAYWDLSQEPTDSQFKLFQKYDAFGPAEYAELAAHCRRQAVDFLSTPFDLEAVDFLAPLMPAFKVASADITNLPLLRKVAAQQKPVLLSTGASTMEEIARAVEELRAAGCQSLALLHCVLNYPTPYENAHLGMISVLRKTYPDKVVGYSDHTLPDEGMLVLLAAYLKGARIIEKHFTDDKTEEGNDHYHAMDEADLKTFMTNLSHLRVCEGPLKPGFLPSEAASRQNARRSLVMAGPGRAGQTLRAEDLICKRPGTGISPVHWDEVLGRHLARDLPDDHILGWDDLL